MPMPEKIISGGQTGVDQAALDVALELSIPCGGWCPRGRWSEDGPIDERYPLVESSSADPAERTERNVRDSDGTLIIARLAKSELTGGTALTHRIAVELGRPLLLTDPRDPQAPSTVAAWLRDNAVGVLNVAGPRESRRPGIYVLAVALLRAVFAI